MFLRSALLASALFTTSLCFSQSIQEGDLLFQQSDCGPFCEAINKVTEGISGIDFSHVGIVVKNRDGELVVLEAVSAGVKETAIEEFLSRSLDTNGIPKVAIGRLKDPLAVDVRKIRKLKTQYLGQKYDDVFDIENDAYYCSELVYYLFTDKKGKPLFDLAPMTFKDPDTGNTFEIWREYYEELGEEIPEGKPGLNPGGISRSDKLEVTFPYSDFQ